MFYMNYDAGNTKSMQAAQNCDASTIGNDLSRTSYFEKISDALK